MSRPWSSKTPSSVARSLQLDRFFGTTPFERSLHPPSPPPSPLSRAGSEPPPDSFSGPLGPHLPRRIRVRVWGGGIGVWGEWFEVWR